MTAKRYTINDAKTARSRFYSEHGLHPEHVLVCGSTATTGSGNDIDLLVLDINNRAGVEAHLRKKGCPCQTAEYEGGSDFVSYRDGEVNILLTTNPAYFLTEATAMVAIAAIATGDLPHDMSTKENRVEYHASMRSFMGYIRSSVNLRTLEPF